MKSLLIILLSACSLQAVSQTAAKDSIKQTINIFFKHMAAKDTGAIRKLLTPNIFMQTVATNKKGETVLITEKIEVWFNQIATLPASIKSLDERIEFEEVKVDGSMAIAWTPFKLYINDTLYSCGVNMFQMVRLQNEWKVNYVIDTRRKNCEASTTNNKKKRKKSS